MKKKILVFSTLSFFVFNNASDIKTEEICTDRKSVCVETIKEHNGSNFVIKNKLNVTKTVTLKFNKLKNLKANAELPYTVTLKSKEEDTNLRLAVIDSDKKFKFSYEFKTVSGDPTAVHNDSYIYTLPYQKGLKSKVLQGFNEKFTHTGEQKYSIDFAMPEGTPVLAARDGIVADIRVDNDKGGKNKSFTKFVNFIIVEHNDKTLGGYYHLKKDGCKVTIGQKVKAGEEIGYSGNTGFSTQPHLHFWVFKALSGDKRESFPIKFYVEKEKIDIPQKGQIYESF
ncbi:MAG: M23 family metallopeptidase [Candidatus Sericytochromatia bacterium]